ncbi:MAG: FAD-dependent oxidoreductase, partial [Planctomycetaceae bacterium]
AVIATGARAVAPPIPGLDSITCLTNETVFSLTELPPRLGIIGAGPIGCELAQTFAQLGSEVFLVEATHGVLPREDQDGAAIIAEALQRSGVHLLCCGKNLRISPGTVRQACLTVESHAQNFSEDVDALLVAAGRSPNVEGLGLEKVGVRVDTESGVIVDDRLRTTNPRIFAAGDVCSNYKFTHAADFMARNVIRNALFLGRAKTSSMLVPWSTYTTPEIAQVGLTREQAIQQGLKISTFTQEFADVDRAVLEDEMEGFVKVHVKAGSDRIVGATIVAPNAGDMISELTLAIQHGIGLSQIAGVIHPYPTQAEAIRKLGDQYNRTRLTPLIAGLFRKWLSLTG